MIDRTRPKIDDFSEFHGLIDKQIDVIRNGQKRLAYLVVFQLPVQTSPGILPDCASTISIGIDCETVVVGDLADLDLFYSGLLPDLPDPVLSFFILVRGQLDLMTIEGERLGNGIKQTVRLLFKQI